MDPERSSKSTTELNDVTAVKETGDPLSTSSEGLFPSGVQEMDNANACQGQPKHLNYSHQPISQEKDKSGPGVESSPKVAENQPPNEGEKIFQMYTMPYSILPDLPLGCMQYKII